MTSYNVINEIKKAIKSNDLELFKKLLEEIEEIPFDIEVSIISKNDPGDFILALNDAGKFSNKAKLLLGSILDKRTRILLKLNNL